MEKTSEKNKVTKSAGEPFFVHNPCNYFQEFIWAVLKCLGFESEPQNSSSNVKDNKGGGDETSCQGSSSSAEQPADPPSSTADPPADPPAAMARTGRTPPRPPISGGRGPQTNTNPS